MIDERIRSSIGAINTLLKAISLFHYQTLQTFTLYRTKVVAKRFKLSIVRTNQTNRTNKTHSFWSNIDIPIDIKCRQKIYCFRSYKKKGGSSDRHIYGFMMDRTTLCVVFFACVSPNKKALALVLALSLSHRFSFLLCFLQLLRTRKICCSSIVLIIIKVTYQIKY